MTHIRADDVALSLPIDRLEKAVFAERAQFLQSLRVVEDGSLVMRYSDRPFHEWEDAGDRVWTSTLAKDIAAVRFRYVDWDYDATSPDWPAGFFWTDEWELDEDSPREDVPLGIEMTLEWQDGRSVTWFRRTMGNSYRERYGKWEPQEDDAS